MLREGAVLSLVPTRALPQCCSPGRAGASWKVRAIWKPCFCPRQQAICCPTAMWATGNISLAECHRQGREEREPFQEVTFFRRFQHSCLVRHTTAWLVIMTSRWLTPVLLVLKPQTYEIILISSEAKCPKKQLPTLKCKENTFIRTEFHWNSKSKQKRKRKKKRKKRGKNPTCQVNLS